MGKWRIADPLAGVYSAKAGEVKLVDVPVMNFLIVAGIGEPDGSDIFRQAADTLKGVTRTIAETALKRTTGPGDHEMPLEMLWWSDEYSAYDLVERETWFWSLMLLQSEIVTLEIISQSSRIYMDRLSLLALPPTRFETLHEGLSAQILHVGPVAEQAAAVEKLYRAIEDRGLYPYGKHHEIYLTEPGTVAPDKMQTLIRRPVRA